MNRGSGSRGRVKFLHFRIAASTVRRRRRVLLPSKNSSQYSLEMGHGGGRESNSPKCQSENGRNPIRTLKNNKANSYWILMMANIGILSESDFESSLFLLFPTKKCTRGSLPACMRKKKYRFHAVVVCASKRYFRVFSNTNTKYVGSQICQRPCFRCNVHTHARARAVPHRKGTVLDLFNEQSGHVPTHCQGQREAGGSHQTNQNYQSR